MRTHQLEGQVGEVEHEQVVATSPASDQALGHGDRAELDEDDGAEAAARRVVVLARGQRQRGGQRARRRRPTTTTRHEDAERSRRGPSGPLPAMVRATSMNSGGPSVTSEQDEPTAAALATR